MTTEISEMRKSLSENFIQMELANRFSEKIHLQRSYQFNVHKDLFQGTLFSIVGIYLLWFDIICDQKRFSQMIKGQRQISWVYVLVYVVFANACLALIVLGFKAYFLGKFRRYIQTLKQITKIHADFEKAKCSQVELVFQIQCYNTMKYGPSLCHQARKSITLIQLETIHQTLEPIDFKNKFRYPYIFVDIVLQCCLADNQQKVIIDNLYKEFIEKERKGDFQKHRIEFRFKKQDDPILRRGYLRNGSKSLLPFFVLVLNFMLLLWPAALLLEFFVQKHKVQLKKKCKLDQQNIIVF